VWHLVWLALVADITQGLLQAGRLPVAAGLQLTCCIANAYAMMGHCATGHQEVWLAVSSSMSKRFHMGHVVAYVLSLTSCQLVGGFLTPNQNAVLIV
jgi:hypothetical protein